MYTPFLGFAPDLEPTVPGLITDCTAMIPTIRGMAGAPTAQSSGVDALAAECHGAAVLKDLAGATRTFAGSTTKLYELSGTSWTDRTRAVGGNYTLSTDARWRFAQFKNIALAASPTDTIQSSSSAAFADITGAPKADIIETSNNFVMAFSTNEATNGDRPNGWACSALNDHTSWTASAATQATTGELADTPGEIRAARRLGDAIIVYKERSTYIGRYVGPPVIWSWAVVSDEIGAHSQEAVVTVMGRHYFAGTEDFYVMDGSKPIPLECPAREWFASNSSASTRYKIQAIVDRTNLRIYWGYLSGATTLPDQAIVYDIRSNKWGRHTLTIEAILEYIQPGFTYDGGSTAYLYSSSETASYDSPFWRSGAQQPAYFDSSHVLKFLTGAAGSGSITTGLIGDDWAYSTITRTRPRFKRKPTTTNLAHFYAAAQGDTLSVGPTATYDDGKFDLLKSARWHNLTYSFTGDVEIMGHDLSLVADGTQ